MPLFFYCKLILFISNIKFINGSNTTLDIDHDNIKIYNTTDTYNEKNALIIPYDALYFESEQAYLYIVEDGKAKKVEVTTGLFDESNAVITDGISKDDMVITTWSAQLRDGVKVSIQNADSDNQNETTTDDSTQE